MSAFAARSLALAASLAASLAAASALAAPTASSGAFHEVHAYWSNGELPKQFKLDITITVDGDTVSYRGVNSTDRTHPHVATWSGKADGQLRAFDGGYFDHMALRAVAPDEYLIEKYREGVLVVGEFWRYVASRDEWVRHGVVARAAADGTSKSYIERFARSKP
ncbi:hypothetical protein [Solimonas marina]|uniref:Uncharacterized protein n=1 Tax=Solimonas marina TaxID=2714601 RepID=A0A969WB75_9GAMM|nr:hypothetical protein [Solimonas marina]NKF22276.1 hypothetical protein [Solimonas marina]